MKHLFPDKNLEKIIENPEEFIKYLIAYCGTDNTGNLLDKLGDFFSKHGNFKS